MRFVVRFANKKVKTSLSKFADFVSLISCFTVQVIFRDVPNVEEKLINLLYLINVTVKSVIFYVTVQRFQEIYTKICLKE